MFQTWQTLHTDCKIQNIDSPQTGSSATGCSSQLCSPVPQPLSPSLGCQQPATAGQLELPPDGQKATRYLQVTPRIYSSCPLGKALQKYTIPADSLCSFNIFQPFPAKMYRTNWNSIMYLPLTTQSITSLPTVRKRSLAVFLLGQYCIGKARWSEEHFLHLSEALPANAWLLCRIKEAAD